MLNYYEESRIINKNLPVEWQSQSALDALSSFLQQNWEQRATFYDDGKITSKQQFVQFTEQKGIRTNNYIGTIIFKGQQLNIFPKIFRTAKDDSERDNLDLKHLMLNLVRWIEYCNKFDYPYIKVSSGLSDSINLRDLFITLYIRYVKAALDRGIFYCYEEKTEDCLVIKGKVDYRDYFLKKYPSGQGEKFSCSFSNFEVDNQLNRIIKYVCTGLINETSKQNQKAIRSILTKLKDVSNVKCCPYDCDAIRLSRLHKHYSVILSMSKIFLLNKSSLYRVGNTESFCFLFPAELLFEGFVGGYLKSILAEVATVRLQASELYLFDDIQFHGEALGKAMIMKHDILVEHKDKGVFIFDTKYKMIDRFEGRDNIKQVITSEINSSDLYQVLSYARTRQLKDIYLLYPMFRYEDTEDSPIICVNTTKDKTSPINVHLIRLPFVFEENSQDVYEGLRKTVLNIFG